MATHSSILAWRIPWTEEPGRPHPWGHRSRTWLKRPSRIPNSWTVLRVLHSNTFYSISCFKNILVIVSWAAFWGGVMGVFLTWDLKHKPPGSKDPSHCKREGTLLSLHGHSASSGHGPRPSGLAGPWSSEHCPLDAHRPGLALLSWLAG